MADERPLIFVIIPAKNAAATLTDTLESLLAQTERNWCAVVVDDGSTDATAKIATSYAMRDARINVICGPCKGVAAARNVGLDQARGKRVHFLDADDWIAPVFYERMTSALTKTGAQVAYCNFQRVMPNGRMTHPYRAPQVEAEPFLAFAELCSVTVMSVLIELKTIQMLGGFDATMSTCEDWDLWLRVARIGCAWTHVDETLAFYRASESSLTSNLQPMLTNGRIVTQLAHREDHRLVGYDQKWPEGLQDGTKNADLTFARYALWHHARECLTGGNGASDFHDLYILRSQQSDSNYLAIVIFDALMVGLRLLPREMAKNWPKFGSNISNFIYELGETWQNPTLARAIQYNIEKNILYADSLEVPRNLSLTIGRRREISDLDIIEIPTSVDRLVMRIDDGTEEIARGECGVLGEVTLHEWAEAVLYNRQIGYRGLRRIFGVKADFHLLRKIFGTMIARPSMIRRPREFIPLVNKLGRLTIARSIKDFVASNRLDNIHQRTAQNIIDTERDKVFCGMSPATTPVITKKRVSESHTIKDRQNYWNQIFDHQDPWNYESSYEVEKYERQIDMLPPGKIALALEVACAEGRFTNVLARHVTRLIATDISEKAIERAKERCKLNENIEFRVVDIGLDTLIAGVDLIICAEVLYYLADKLELRKVAHKLASSLATGGHLICTHAFVLNDEPSRAGFDWTVPFGAKTINEVFLNVQGLALEHSIITELYRIDRYKKVVGSTVSHDGLTTIMPICAELPVEVSRQIIWTGTRTSRAKAATEKRLQIPILMYHGIGSDGPQALNRYRITTELFQRQMTWLRHNGYHTITSDQLAWILHRGEPINGRPVMITFDDGYQSFADLAWPILRGYNFIPEVFVVTDLIGEFARWDDYPDVSPLMSLNVIKELSIEGVEFGSHMATHRAIDGLSTRDLLTELARSSSIISSITGAIPRGLALPYSIPDHRLPVLAQQAGYQVVFGSRTGVAHVLDDPFDLARIEIKGDTTLDEFIRTMEVYL